MPDITVLRDWVIVIVGILGILMLLGLLIVSLILISKIMSLVNKVKHIANAVDSAIRSPYYEVASWVGEVCAGFTSGMQKGSKIFSKKE